MQLLPDTKLTEYIIQLIFIGDGAGYFAKMVEAGLDIQRQQVARKLFIQSLDDGL